MLERVEAVSRISTVVNRILVSLAVVSWDR